MRRGALERRARAETRSAKRVADATTSLMGLRSASPRCARGLKQPALAATEAAGPSPTSVGACSFPSAEWRERCVAHCRSSRRFRSAHPARGCETVRASALPSRDAPSCIGALRRAAASGPHRATRIRDNDRQHDRVVVSLDLRPLVGSSRVREGFPACTRSHRPRVVLGVAGRFVRPARVGPRILLRPTRVRFHSTPVAKREIKPKSQAFSRRRRDLRSRPGDAPETLVGNCERRRVVIRRQPRRQEAIAVRAVIDAARVETAQQRRDVQSLRRPMSVDDAVVGIVRSPASMPRVVGSRGFATRPATARVDAARAREAREHVGVGIVARASRRAVASLRAAIRAAAPRRDARCARRSSSDQPGATDACTIAKSCAPIASRLRRAASCAPIRATTRRRPASSTSWKVSSGARSRWPHATRSSDRS